MAITIDKDAKVGIIDRTILELFLLDQHTKSYPKKLGFIYLCWLLNRYGVDVFELSCQLAKTLKRLPSGLDFIVRVEVEKDIECLEALKIKKCIVNEKHATNRLMQQIKSKGISITLEIPIMKEADIAFSIMKVQDNFSNIDVLRILGLERVESLTWMSQIKSILSPNIKIDICPSNRLYMATAIALEATLNYADYVTATFTGVGGTCGFAAVEEVLLAMMILKGNTNNITLKTLPDAVSHFKKISGLYMSPIKPVIGKNIFMVESGLHADGIQKNPVTYELFDPDLVGQKRSILIGKHSGRASIIFKLKEMGIECTPDEAEQFLRVVRDISIHSGRYLNEEETASLYKILHRDEGKIITDKFLQKL